MNNQSLSSCEGSAFDIKMMERALSLAELGRYSTHPNPHVGCVIVNQSKQIVGEGYHQKAGQAHAEVNALKQAGENAKGACVYVTLEPCAHTGRTGPCANALVDARVRKVYVACLDPNPKVSGRGIGILQQAGIEVIVGVCNEQALALNRAFFYRQQNKRPFVTVKLASSMDGKTALASGESKWITSAAARKDVQKHRACIDAILTGADTVLADNPQLNVRANELDAEVAKLFAQREGQPLRVIIDSKNRLDKDKHKIFNDGQVSIVYNIEHNPNLSAKQQQQISNCKKDARLFVDLNAVLQDLAEREINHVWVEAGATLCGALFDLNLVNELILYQAPKFLGVDARGLINLKSIEKLSDAMHGEVISVEQIGDDIKSIVRFHSPLENTKGL